MKIKIVEIRKTLEKILSQQGYKKSDAKILADEYLEGELQSKKSHGLAAFPAYLMAQEQEYAKQKKSFKIVKETGSYVFIDARQTRGILTGRILADLLLKKAEKSGVALGVIKNMKAWLRPGSIARYIASKGQLALVANNGGRPMMSPVGGCEPAIGTNPIGIGIPTADEPLVIDMATSVRAWGEVRNALREGRNLPDNAFLDQEGNVTQDPKKAFSAMPAGGHKGFALGLLVEILGGSLVGMAMGKKLHSVFGSQYTMALRGGMILVINPAFSTSKSKFKKANSELFDTIRNSTQRDNKEKIVLPGDRANTTRAQNLQRGHLEVDEGIWNEILKFVKGKPQNVVN